MQAIRRIGRSRTAVVTALGAVLTLALGGGCSSMGQKRVAASEPSLSGSVDGGTTIAATPAPPGTSLTWVDRHPLFSKPRDLYDTTNSNKVVKTAAAAIVGIPVGFVGELRQIVVGNPNSATKY